MQRSRGALFPSLTVKKMATRRALSIGPSGLQSQNKVKKERFLRFSEARSRQQGYYVDRSYSYVGWLSLHPLLLAMLLRSSAVCLRRAEACKKDLKCARARAWRVEIFFVSLQRTDRENRDNKRCNTHSSIFVLQTYLSRRGNYYE